ncbi:putative MFS sugar transporter protein [Xylariales sp. AK1849]|nr:putative MFS sugar transporter protein [Xylariales sp. AK1849]
MADPTIKTGVAHVDAVETAEKLGTTVDEVIATRMTEEDMMRISASSLAFRSRTGLRICGIMFVMGCNQAGYGIDWAVISGINSYDTWHNYYGFGNTGVTIGTINALMTVGTFVGAPFLALGDTFGRRGVNFIGNAIVIVAALLQGLAPNLPAFFVGRLLLGFGTALCTAPQYMAEIAPVHLRGRLVGIFGACFQVGSIVMNAAMMGFTKWNSDWQWRTPLILEGLFPFIVCATIYFLCPESPRYLMMKGKREEARTVIARYMTTHNDPNAPIVPLIMAQIDESLEESNTGVRAAWDYRVFFTKQVRYRTMVLLVYSIFQQWNGGGIIGNYLSPALDTIGITESLDQLGINLGLTAIYFVFTAFGSYLIDIFRRRTLIFTGLISIIIAQTAVTITSWQYEQTGGSRATAILTVFWIFAFQICSASFIATMHNLYPVEILSLPLRAKGMGLYSMFQSAAGVVNTYAISLGIAQLGYKIWAVYIGYNLVQLVASYFIFPETSKLSLEEIDTIFETKKTDPVKLSLKISRAKREREKAARVESETPA